MFGDKECVTTFHGNTRCKHKKHKQNNGILNYGQNRNSLIIVKTLLIQQAGICNGGLETGQIANILGLPICLIIGVNETKLAHLNSIKLNIF